MIRTTQKQSPDRDKTEMNIYRNKSINKILAISEGKKKEEGILEDSLKETTKDKIDRDKEYKKIDNKTDFVKEKDKNKEKERDKNNERSKNRGKENERDKNREKESEKENERRKDRNKDKDKSSYRRNNQKRNNQYHLVVLHLQVQVNLKASTQAITLLLHD
jgi:hypothetical protein